MNLSQNNYGQNSDDREKRRIRLRQGRWRRRRRRGRIDEGGDGDTDDDSVDGDDGGEDNGGEVDGDEVLGDGIFFSFFVYHDNTKYCIMCGLRKHIACQSHVQFASSRNTLIQNFPNLLCLYIACSSRTIGMDTVSMFCSRAIIVVCPIEVIFDRHF